MAVRNPTLMKPAKAASGMKGADSFRADDGGRTTGVPPLRLDTLKLASGSDHDAKEGEEAAPPKAAKKDK
eukprot:CAMPEP_0118861936 /NCGR_PEP_ID=MMETSP1163-20130328/7304_1 /TAXON_ID=124430 /ORGANISM="Phaeomonas parva, Strain CCMP2877" /LENGTH=69 /DNA_ID=CAMNT_0006795787 /DNA_START=21 /DNA_END=227 /DNA_ORIENTATION=+